YFIKLSFGEGIADSMCPIGQSSSAASRCQSNSGFVHTDFLGINDLIGLPVFDNTVLVDSGGVRKSIGTDDRFVWLHHHPHFLSDQSADRVEQSGVNISMHVQAGVL